MPDESDAQAPQRAGWRKLLLPLLAASLALSVAALVVASISLARGGGTSSSAPQSGGGGGSCTARTAVDHTMPSVVTILVQSNGGSQGNGSGSFIDDEGHILTNNHVIAAAAQGGKITVQRPNGEQETAKIVGRDRLTDLAVIKVDAKSKITPITFGKAPAVGDKVFAIGAPLGLTDTITSGIVGALGRSVRVPAEGDSTALLTSAIQTDAPINPGNSGGVLADCSGKLVGVPTAGATAQDSAGEPVAGSIGLGFAIPADFAHRIAEKLIADGRVAHADAGMAVAPVIRGEGSTNVNGLFVSAVAKGGPADEAGLRQGDVIIKLGDDEVTSPDQLQDLLLNKQAGDSLKVTYKRGDEQHTATLKLTSE